jgi:hypothetical protein
MTELTPEKWDRPTLDELRQIFDDHAGLLDDTPTMWWVDFRSAAKVLLDRWGNHPESPDSSTQPIPVIERLPVAENCNADGDVWAWRRFDPEGDMDNGDHWMLAFHEWLEDEECGFTHWLPSHAMPLPS